jgi:WD40 repeat protein
MSEAHSSGAKKVNNEKCLRELAWVITMSQGQFSLILARCNYTRLREQLVQHLHKICSVPIREITLKPSANRLYSQIQAELGEEKPSAVMVLGLESVQDKNIDHLLTSMNQVREEFRKYCPFPLVLWVNDEIARKLIRQVPDIESWAKYTVFSVSNNNLLKALRQESDRLFDALLNAGAECFLSNEDIFGSCYHLELDAALRDLEKSDQQLPPDLEACLQFVRGRARNCLDEAIIDYQQSLAFWQQSNNLVRQGALLFYIGLCHYRKGQLERSNSLEHWQNARPYFEQCLNCFEQAQRSDLVAKFIGQLGKVLRRLEQWDELQKLAEKSLKLDKTYGLTVQIAQNYGFLAQVALERQQSAKAKKLAEKALQTLEDLPTQQHQYKGLYLLLLARSLRQLGQLEEASGYLEQAKAGDPQENRQFYIQILEELRSLYFKLGQYLKAFEVKKEQRSIEQRLGIRPFIGAGRLQPELHEQPALAKSDYQETVAQEIRASGRDKHIKELIQRIESYQHKLTVIYGHSGVGKSSMIEAGLVPALKQKIIKTRDVLPIVLRTYTNWDKELGNCLAKALPIVENNEQINLSNGYTLDKICEKLAHIDKNNWLPVLIFDQFEEFLLLGKNSTQCQRFFEFLRECLEIYSLKVIFSLREDYLHLLLQPTRRTPLNAINNDILSKNVLYSVGNFSPPEAKSIILSLTKSSEFYLEEVLVDELVHELDLNEPVGEVRPIELQIVGAQLYDDKITTLGKYQKPEYKGKLVQRYLESVVKDCGTENESIAWLVLFLLTDENNPRPLKTLGDLKKGLLTLLDDDDNYRPLKTIEDLRQELQSGIFYNDKNKLDLVLRDLILKFFVESGLVVLWRGYPVNHYQLVHDYLASFIRKQKVAGLLAKIEKERKERERERVEREQARVQRNQELQQRLQEQERERVERERAQAQRNQELQRTLRRGGIAISFLVLVAVMGVWGLLDQRYKKKIAKIEEIIAKSETLFQENKELEALEEAVRAKRKFQKLGASQEDKIESSIDKILQQGIYSFNEYKEYNSLAGHKDAIIQVVFSPNGQIIATASFDKTVKLWQRDGTSILTKNPIEHKDKINSLDFSPDGQMLATASFDKTVKLWKTDGTIVRILEGHKDGVFGVAFSPDGKTIATASADTTIKLWKTDGTLLKTLEEHSSVVDGIAFSPDDEIIASASWDRTVKLWKADGTFLRTLEDETLKVGKSHSDRVHGVAFSPDGQMIASVSKDKTAKLWNIDGTLLHTLQGHTDKVIRVDFSPDGEKIATTSWDRTIKLWRTTDGTLLETLEGHTDGIFGVEFSLDRQILATASEDDTVKLWKRDNNLGKKILKEHSQEVESIAFSHDAETIATANEDGTVNLWSTKDGILLNTLPKDSLKEDQPRLYLYKVALSPKGQIIATVSEVEEADKVDASKVQRIKLWNAEGILLTTWDEPTERINSIAISPDNQIIATVHKDKTIKLWNRNGTLIDTLQGHHDQVVGIDFSPDSQLIATVSWDDEGKLWQRDGNKYKFQKPSLNGHSGEVIAVAFSSDGEIVATGGKDRTTKLWNTTDGELLRTLEGHAAEVYELAFSPDGKLIATMSKDRTVKIWNTDGELQTTFSGPENLDWSVRFKSNNQLIASVIDDNTVIVWNLELDQQKLLERACARLQNYLKNSSRVEKNSSLEQSNPKPLWERLWDYLYRRESFEQSDRTLCDDVPPPQ